MGKKESSQTDNDIHYKSVSKGRTVNKSCEAIGFYRKKINKENYILYLSWHTQKTFLLH
jgi:hypothetical protein